MDETERRARFGRLGLGPRQRQPRLLAGDDARRQEHQQKHRGRPAQTCAPRHVDDPTLPAILVRHRRVALHDGAEAGAVDVRDVGEIEEHIAPALLDQAAQLVLHHRVAAVAQGHLA